MFIYWLNSLPTYFKLKIILNNFIVEAKTEKTLVITLKDTEIKDFKSCIEKCNSEASKIGFNKTFTEDESKLLKTLKETL